MADQFSVTIEELAGSPRTSATFDGQTQGVRRIKVAWTDHKLLLEELLGYAEELDDGGGGTDVIFIPPAQWPDPAFASLYCTKAKVDPLGGDDAKMVGAAGGLDANGLPEYEHAIITATYEVPPFNSGSFGNQDLREERVEFSSEYQPLSKEGMAWDAAGTEPLPADVTVGKTMGTIDFLVYKPVVPFFPVVPVALAVGTVNPDPVSGFGITDVFGPETLLFLPPSSQRSVQSNGLVRWSIQYRLSFKATGWNNFFDPNADSEPTYKPIYRQVSETQWNQFRVHPLGNWLGLVT